MRKRELNKLARECFDKHIKSLAPGETSHCNHEGCPAGVDTKSRLYFTRKNNPTELVVWFCHNCTEGGAFNTSGKAALAPRAVAKKGNEMQYIADVMARSIDVTRLIGTVLSHEQQSWLTTNQPLHYWAYYPDDTILYDPIDQSIVFPIWTTNPEQDAMPLPLAMQKRYHREYGPKCITTKANEGVSVRTFLSVGEGVDTPVVVVEDMLSGLRVVRDTGYTAYVLFGNHMDMTEMVQHKDKFKDGLIVWLDNDNDQVLENAAKIHKRAQMLGLKTVRIDIRAEPKKLTVPALQMMLGDE